MNTPRRTSVNNNKVILNALLIFAPLMIIIILMTLRLYSSDKALHITEAEAAAQKAMIDKQQCLTRQTSNIIHDLDFISMLTGTTELLENGSSAHKQHMQDVLIKLSNAKKVYDQLRYINSKGQEMLRINYDTHAGAYAVADTLLQNKSQRYYFREAIQLGPSGYYISPLDLNIEHGELEIPFKPMLRFAKPVMDTNGKPSGIVIMNYLGQTLIDRFADHGTARHNRLLLLNKEGYYFYGAPDDKNWGFMFPGTEQAVSFQQSFPEEWQRMQGSQEGQFSTKNGLFTFKQLFPLADAGKALSADYYWLMVSHIPPARLAEMVPQAFDYCLLNALMGIVLLSGSIVLTYRIEVNRIARRNLENLTRELRKTNSIINQRENLLATTQTITRAGGWEYDVNTGAMCWTDQTYLIHGLDPEQSYNYNARELLAVSLRCLLPEYRNRLSSAFKQCIRHGKQYDVIIPFTTVTGKKLWIRTAGKPVREHGIIQKVIGSIIDITDQKEAEEKLRKKTYELQAFYRHSPNILTIFSPTGTTLMANPAALSFFERSAEEIIGKSYTDFLPRDLTADFPDRLQQTIETGTSITVHDHIVKNGNEHFFQNIFFPINSSDGIVRMVGFTGIDTTEKERASINLKENQRKLQALLSNLPGMAYRCLNSPDWPMEFVSHGCYSLTGYQARELTHDENRVNFNDLIHPHDRTEVWQTVQAAVQKKERFNLRYRIRRKSGTIAHMHELGAGVFDASGQLVALEGFIMDISEQVIYEKALRENEARFRTLFDGAPDAIFLSNPATGELIGANNKASLMTGLKVDEITGQHFSSMHPPEEYQTVIRQFEAQKEEAGINGSSIPREYHLMHTSGKTIPVEVICQAIQLDNRSIIYGIFRDISARKAAESKAQEKAQLLETVTQSVPAYIYLKDKDLQYTFANRYTLEKYHLSLKEIIGKTDFDFFPPEFAASYRQDDTMVLSTHDPLINKEETLALPDGEIIPVLTNKIPLVNENGRTNGILSISMDRSEQKKSEEKNRILEIQLQNSQKMEILGTLSGGIAHDFNNILTPIMGFTEMAICAVPEKSQTAEDLNIVLAAAKRAKKLVQQMLTFSRKEQPKLVSQSLLPIIRESINFLKPSIPSTVRIEENIDSFKETIFCDASQIQQVIINICNNAWQAMEGNRGILSISLSTTTIDQKTSEKNDNLHPGDTYALLKISDTGKGMDKHELSKIFDPFYTTKAVGKGTGLGLSVVYGIIKEHDGHISVTSDKNKGTTVSIFLPLSKQGSKTQ